MKWQILLLNGVLALTIASSTVSAQNQDRVQEQERQQPYGWERMTEQQRNEYQREIRNMKTEQEREAYRSQHEQKMRQRAREQGVGVTNGSPGMGKGNNKSKGKGKGT